MASEEARYYVKKAGIYWHVRTREEWVCECDKAQWARLIARRLNAGVPKKRNPKEPPCPPQNKR